MAESLVLAALSSKLCIRTSSKNGQLTRPGFKNQKQYWDWLKAIKTNSRKGLPKRLERNHRIFRVQAYIGSELI